MVDIDASTAALASRLNLDPPSSAPQRAVVVPLHVQSQCHGYRSSSAFPMGVQHGVEVLHLPQAGFNPGFTPGAQAMVLPPGGVDWGAMSSQPPGGEPCYQGFPGYPVGAGELTSQGVFKRAWTAEEDAKLLQLGKDHGAQSWSVIADKLPGRVGKQCRERYKLAPTPTTPIAHTRRDSAGACYSIAPHTPEVSS